MAEHNKHMIFRIGEETGPIVLTQSNYSESPFRGVLDKSMDVLSSMIRSYNDLKRKGCITPLEGFDDNSGNNVIAFIGDRGSGKSSCLLTIHKLYSSFQCTIGGVVKETKIEFLPIIDPSFFDNEHNILEIFIGELYRNYRKIIKESESRNLTREELHNIQELQGEFTKVKRALRYIDTKSKNFEDEHTELLRLSDGMNLSKLICNLIDKYLKCKNKDFLVVSIDDIDLNVAHAYTMMEQIRKYLRHWNVAVLMAGKYDQLRQCITHQMAESFDSIIGRNLEFEEIVEMADRYLDKFMPLDQRMYMPVVKDYFDSYKLTIIEGNENRTYLKHEYDSIHFAVPKLIFDKCGYLFYNSTNESSPIIPLNLRELRMLVTMLVNMPQRDGEDIKENKENHESNKSVFKNYFYNQCISNLPKQHWDWMRSLISEPNLGKINKLIVSHLFNSYYDLRTYQENENDSQTENNDVIEDDRQNQIVNLIGISENKSRNISIGDVMAVLESLKEISDSSDTYKLIFFIKSFYSIMLYEAYDRMTNIELTKELDEDISIPLLKSDDAYDSVDYFKLVGTSMFLLDGKSFLPPRQGSLEGRELALLDGKKIFDEIRKFVGRSKFQDFRDANNIIKDDEIYKFNLIEFFILTSSRRIDLKVEKKYASNMSKWRSWAPIKYFQPFSYGTKNILFDVSAPFINMVNPMLSYSRYDSRFFEMALKYNGSLLNKLLKTNRRYAKDDIIHSEETDLMSRVAVRNVEVLEDINKWLKKERFNLRPEGNGDIGLLSQFFGLFGENGKGYRIKTYDVNGNKSNIHINYHNITFHPIAVLSEFLKCILPSKISRHSNDISEAEMKCIKECIELFNRIYRLETRITGEQEYTLEEVLSILNNETQENLIEKADMIKESFIDNDILTGIRIAESLAKKVEHKNQIIIDIFEENLYRSYTNAIEFNLNKSVAALEQIYDGFKIKRSEHNDFMKSLENEHKNCENQITLIESKLKSKSSNLAKLNFEIDNLLTKKDDSIALLAEYRKQNQNTQIEISKIQDFDSYKYKDLVKMKEHQESEIANLLFNIESITVKIEQTIFERDQTSDLIIKTKSELSELREKTEDIKRAMESERSNYQAFEKSFRKASSDLLIAKRQRAAIISH